MRSDDAVTLPLLSRAAAVAQTHGQREIRPVHLLLAVLMTPEAAVAAAISSEHFLADIALRYPAPAGTINDRRIDATAPALSLATQHVLAVALGDAIARGASGPTDADFLRALASLSISADREVGALFEAWPEVRARASSLSSGR